MRIFLNDDAHDVEPGTLAAAARPKTALADGDRVEVVAPMQGG